MGTKLNTYAIGDVDLTNIMTVLDQTRIGGVMQVSLTNLSNTTVPAIAAGSFLEVAGALYLVSTEEAISTTDPVTSATVADGSIYIMAIPSGNSIAFSFTATAPTWSDIKQGWYGTGTYAGCRYVGKVRKSSSSYENKKIIDSYAAAAPVFKTEKVTVAVDFNTKNCAYGNYIKIDSISEKKIDTHNALSSLGIFTAPVSGVYQISSTVACSSGSVTVYVYKNSARSAMVNSCGVSFSASNMASVWMDKGNSLEFYVYITVENSNITLSNIVISLVEAF